MVKTLFLYFPLVLSMWYPSDPWKYFKITHSYFKVYLDSTSGIVQTKFLLVAIYPILWRPYLATFLLTSSFSVNLVWIFIMHTLEIRLSLSHILWRVSSFSCFIRESLLWIQPLIRKSSLHSWNNNKSHY